jgi:hypothetical protein
LHQDEQPVHAIELESSSKNPQTHPEASYHQLLKALEEGRVEIKISIPNPIPPSAHLVHFSVFHVWWRHLALKLLFKK